VKKRRRGSRSLPRSSRFQSNHLLDDNTHFLIAFKNTLLLLFYQKKKDQVQTVTHWEHFNTPANYPGTLYLIVLPWSDVLEWNVYTMAYGVPQIMYFATESYFYISVHVFLRHLEFQVEGIPNQEYGMIWLDASITDKSPCLMFLNIQTSYLLCTDNEVKWS